jgi:hypothetical protein
MTEDGQISDEEERRRSVVTEPLPCDFPEGTAKARKCLFRSNILLPLTVNLPLFVRRQYVYGVVCL